MFENSRKNQVRRLEPKRNIIINDINFSEINLSALSTIILVAALFLISTRLFLITGV